MLSKIAACRLGLFFTISAATTACDAPKGDASESAPAPPNNISDTNGSSESTDKQASSNTTTDTDSQGNTGSDTNTDTGSSTQVQLGPFAISPVADATSASIPLTIGWAHSENAAEYQILVVPDDADCSASPVASQDHLKSEDFQIQALENGHYRICVNAKSGTSTVAATNSGEIKFSVQRALGSFTIDSPPTYNNSSPAVSWSGSSFATKYKLSVSNSPDCSSPIETISAQKDDQTKTLTSLADGQYHVCLIAEDNLGTQVSASNSPLLITVDTTPPGAFSIVGPSGSQGTSTPTATWGASPGADTYSLKVSKVSNCTNPIKTVDAILGVSQNIGRLDDGQYYICVNASDSAGNSTSSSNSGADFTINSWKTLGTQATVPGPVAPSWTPYYVWTGTKLIVWSRDQQNGQNTGLPVGYSYNPTSHQWAKISTQNAPTLGADFSMIWTGSKIIFWGGQYSTADDTNSRSGFTYDPSDDTWATISKTNAPSGRWGHSAIWTGSKMIVWGGQYFCFGLTCYRDDGGTYDPSTDTWTAISTASPPSARAFHTATWTGSKMVIFGGYTMVGATNSYAGVGKVYSPGTNTWSSMSGVGAPLNRARHSAIWTGSKVIVWGGRANNANQYRGDGSAYDPVGNTWTAISSVDSPSGRENHRALWNGTEMIILGGDNGFALRSGGRYDPSNDTWAPVSMVDAPTSRQSPVAVWTGSKALVWGGFEYSAFFGSGSEYDSTTDTWSSITPDSLQDPRSHFSKVWTGSEMLIWGGLVGNNATNSGAKYSPGSDSWAAISQAGAPSSRYQASAVWTGSEMLVWGGSAYPGGNGLETGDGAAFDPALNSWSLISNTNAPSKRIGHIALWTGGNMFVWGGSVWNAGTSSFDRLDDGALYNRASDSWLPVSVSPLSARTGHVGAWTGTEIIIWGGASSAGPLSNGAKYDPNSNQWTLVATTNAPQLSSATAVWTGTRLIVWGRKAGSDTNAGGMYNPSDDSWVTMSTTDQPSTLRNDPSIVWTGTKMLLWGGSDLSAENYVSVFDPASNTWERVSGQFAPKNRISQGGAWTGSDLFVWGGIQGGTTWLNSGGLFRYP